MVAGVHPDLASLRDALGEEAPDCRLSALPYAPEVVEVAPSSIEEASKVMSVAHRLRARVLVTGAGTKLGMGGEPAGVEVLLSTRNLAALVEHEPTDLTCVVQPGMSLRALQARLGEHGQRLAVDPPFAGRATIGGIVTTNSSGPKRLLYGTPRDLVIGMRCVQPDGRVSKSGGKVVKNVTGYDLNKLYTGSWGTLGLIAEVNFKVMPLAEAQRLLLARFERVEEASRAAVAVNRAGLYPAALELFNEPTRRLLLPDIAGEAGIYLAVAYEGAQAGMERQISASLEVARAHGGAELARLEGGPLEGFWQRMSDLAELVAPEGQRLGLKATTLPTSLPAVYAALMEAAHRLALDPAILCHAGSGILYAISPAEGADPVPTCETINAIRRVAREHDGALVVEWAPAELKRRLDLWGEQRADLRIMRSIKRALDPDEIMAAGRFVGGI